MAAAAAQRRRVLPGTPDILAVFSTSPVSLSMPRALSFESWLYIRTPDRTKRSNYSSAPPTQDVEFLFLSQRARRDAFGGSIAPKTPVLKLKCLFACEPPAAIGSESTQVAFKQFAKPQVAGLHC